MFEFFEHLHFLRPWLFTLIFPLILLYWMGRRASARQNPWGRFIKTELLEAILLKESPQQGIGPLGLGMGISLVWILAMSGPTWQQLPSSLNKAEKNVLIILELDDSMLTNDMYPSRLVHAKLKIKSLLVSLKSSPLGLIVYSGSSHLVLPFTTDQSVFVHYLDGLSPAIMPKQGHDLAGAIEFAKGVVAGSETSVILLTDGDYQGEYLSQRFSSSSILWLFGDQEHRASVDRGLYQKSGFTIVETSIDEADIDEILRKLNQTWSAVELTGEEVWLDAGYYLVWLLLLMMLYWFRPGMVISWD